MLTLLKGTNWFKVEQRPRTMFLSIFGGLNNA